MTRFTDIAPCSCVIVVALVSKLAHRKFVMYIDLFSAFGEPMPGHNSCYQD